MVEAVQIRLVCWVDKVAVQEAGEESALHGWWEQIGDELQTYRMLSGKSLDTGCKEVPCGLRAYLLGVPPAMIATYGCHACTLPGMSLCSKIGTGRVEVSTSTDSDFRKA